jgi:hypothetical protein
VKFKHTSYDHENSHARPQAQKLWLALVGLAATEDFSQLLGSMLIGMNMYPKKLPRDAKSDFTRGIMVQKFNLTIQHVVSEVSNPLAFVMDSA